MTTQDLANMSQAEMAMRLEPDQSLYTGWQKAGYKGQMRGKVSTTGVIVSQVRSDRDTTEWRWYLWW